MSKILDATCAAGIVLAGAPVPLPVLPVTILGQGVGPSTGIVVIEEGTPTYIPNTSGDLAATLDTVISALGNITTSLAAIAASMTGPTTAPPPTLAVDLARITANAATLTTLRAILK